MPAGELSRYEPELYIVDRPSPVRMNDTLLSDGTRWIRLIRCASSIIIEVAQRSSASRMSSRCILVCQMAG